MLAKPVIFGKSNKTLGDLSPMTSPPSSPHVVGPGHSSLFALPWTCKKSILHFQVNRNFVSGGAPHSCFKFHVLTSLNKNRQVTRHDWSFPVLWVVIKGQTRKVMVRTPSILFCMWLRALLSFYSSFLSWEDWFRIYKVTPTQVLG